MTTTVRYGCACTATPHSPLGALYWCTHCHVVRCAGWKCAREEIACFYCPACLFEVPSSSARTDHGRCGRNCFECPACASSAALLVVQWEGEGGAPGASVSGGTNVQGSASEMTAAAPETTRAPPSTDPTDPNASTAPPRYTLACAACHWNAATALAWTFERPVGVAAQVQKLTDMIAGDAREITHMRHYYEQLMAYHQTAQTQSALPRHWRATGGKTATSSLRPALVRKLAAMSTASGGRGGTSDVVKEPVYEPWSHTNGGQNGGQSQSEDMEQLELERELAEAMARTSADGVPTLAQLQGQPRRQDTGTITATIHQLLPRPMHLRTKRNKRCVGCRHILVKCEPKVQVAKHKLKLMAWNYVPRVSVVGQDGGGCGVRLKVRNPLDRPVRLRVAGANAVNGSIMNPAASPVILDLGECHPHDLGDDALPDHAEFDINVTVPSQKPEESQDYLVEIGLELTVFDVKDGDSEHGDSFRCTVTIPREDVKSK